MHKQFWDFLHFNDIEQPINFPTHILGNTLDLILSMIDIEYSVVEPTISDHHAIMCNIAVPITKEQGKCESAKNVFGILAKLRCQISPFRAGS